MTACDNCYSLFCIDPHFSCHCAPNYHGIHCASRSNDCSSGSNQELCGHGSCISDDQNGFKCICEQVRMLFFSIFGKAIDFNAIKKISK